MSETIEKISREEFDEEIERRRKSGQKPVASYRGTLVLRSGGNREWGIATWPDGWTCEYRWDGDARHSEWYEPLGGRFAKPIRPVAGRKERSMSTTQKTATEIKITHDYQHHIALIDGEWMVLGDTLRIIRRALPNEISRAIPALAAKPLLGTLNANLADGGNEADGRA